MHCARVAERNVIEDNYLDLKMGHVTHDRVYAAQGIPSSIGILHVPVHYCGYFHGIKFVIIYTPQCA